MLKIMALADHARIRMAPHFAMEIHLHLSAAYAHEPWVEHFEWLEPLFNERLQIRDGRMIVPNRPGLGFSLSEQARVGLCAFGGSLKCLQPPSRDADALVAGFQEAVQFADASPNPSVGEFLAELEAAGEPASIVGAVG